MNSDGPISELRAGTRDQHQALEAALGMMTPGATVDDYVRYLAGMRQVHDALEPRLEAALRPWHAELALAERRKAHLIQADLVTLAVPGMGPDRAAGAAEDASVEPTQGAVPNLETPDRAFGAMFVLEGSMLGGPHVRRHLLKRFGDRIAGATTYLESYGPQRRAMWSAFRSVLNAYVTEHPSSMPAMMAGAREVFAFVRTILAGAGAADAPDVPVPVDAEQRRTRPAGSRTRIVA